MTAILILFWSFLAGTCLADLVNPSRSWKGHVLDGACVVIFAALVIELVLR